MSFEDRSNLKGRKAQDAVRTKIKAAIGIDGPSGNGKTGLALLFAAGFAKNDFTKIHVTDSENNSALLYVGKTLSTGVKCGSFKHFPLTKDDGFSPFNYEYCREDAVKQQCEVAIMDSFTHAWQREGGVLDTVNKLAAKNGRDNKFNAWGDPNIVDGKNLIFSLVRDSRLHVIATVRVKEAYAMQTNDKGKAEVISLGEKQMQQEGLQYEFDLMLSMLEPGTADGKPPRVRVDKSRYDIFQKGQEYFVTKELIEALIQYLEEGADPAILEERMRKEMIESMRERVQNNRMLSTIFRNKYPKTETTTPSLDDLTLKQLREMNADFLAIEYDPAKR